MKKAIFLFIVLILYACTPQVIESPIVTLAPPTQTPIPTPTLHPQFIELQNLINDASDRYTLTPDGLIEEVTANGGRQTVPNLHVDQNGIINLIINNEHVVIEQSQITFDDENGLIINGYTLDEDNNWVEEETTPANIENLATTDLVKSAESWPEVLHVKLEDFPAFAQKLTEMFEAGEFGAFPEGAKPYKPTVMDGENYQFYLGTGYGDWYDDNRSGSSTVETGVVVVTDSQGKPLYITTPTFMSVEREDGKNYGLFNQSRLWTEEWDSEHPSRTARLMMDYASDIKYGPVRLTEGILQTPNGAHQVQGCVSYTSAFGMSRETQACKEYVRSMYPEEALETFAKTGIYPLELMDDVILYMKRQ